MEGSLLRIWFEKLLDALRIGPGPTPSSQVDAAPERFSEPFSVVSNGLTIRGRIFFPVANPSRLYPALIICHGIPGSGAQRPENDPGYEGLAQEFTSLGVSAVIFNFRGCGESDGNFDMMGWTRDLEAVVGQILNTPHIDPTRLILLGFSGGGAAAINVGAENRSIYGLAVVGTPAHFGIFEKDADEIVSEFKDRGIIRDPDFPPDIDRWIDGFEQIEPRRWISHFEGRYLLIVHGDEDELIPVDHARELFNRAPSGEAKLSIIPGGEHRLRLDSRCIEIVKTWLLEILGWKA
jgi:pimeloyl-ACP methyl ester carboxylesterase